MKNLPVNNKISIDSAQSNKIKKSTSESITEIFFSLDNNGCFTYLDKQACKYFHLDPVTSVGKNVWIEFPQLINTPFYNTFIEVVEKREFKFLSKYSDIFSFWYESFFYPSINGVSIFIRDITKIIHSEYQINKINRLYLFVSRINQLIIRVTDTETLFKEFCRIALEVGNFQMAWIGKVDMTTGDIIPVCSDGEELGYLSQIKINVNSLAPESRGPIATAIQEKKFRISNDIEYDPVMIPWRAEALARNYYSCMAIPIIIFGEVFGVIVVYSSQKNYFDDEEIRLLTEVADDISFAMENIEKEIIRKKREKEIEISEIKYRQAQQIGHIGSWEYDIKNNLFWGSDEAKRIYGFDEGAKNFNFETVTGCVVDRSQADPALRDLLKENKPYNIEFEILPVNSLKRKTIHSVAELQRDDDGVPVKVIGILQDITERKQIENELMRTSQLLQKTSKLSKTGGWELDLETRELTWTLETYNIYEIDPLVKPTLDIFLGFCSVEIKQNIEASFQTVIKNGTSDDYEFPIRMANGRQIWIKGQVFPISEKGKVVKLNGYFQDITERKNAEKQYSDLFNLSPQPMWSYDLQTLKFIQVNKAAIENYGYTENEFLNMTVLDIRPEDEISDTKEFIEQHRIDQDKKHTKKFIHQKKSGETFDVEIFSTTILSNEKRIGSVIAIDVTEKNRHQHEIMKAIIKTQEDERYELGGELHDNISQILVAIKLSLGMIEKSIEVSQMKWVMQCKEYITLAIEEIRNLSHRLAPVFFQDKTLEDAFRKLFNDMNVEDKFEVKMSYDDEIRKNRINPEIQINIYRIMQEQLKNILKYSKATTIEVDLLIIDNTISLRIADNGIGFDQDNVRKGIGLTNIKRRTELFSGILTIETSPGNGCIIDVSIPYKEMAFSEN